jgi:hypothetical protein
MAEKTAKGLVEWAKSRLGCPYWYGADCEPCTEKLLSRLKQIHPGHYTSARLARYWDDIVNERNASDCSGLIVGYLGGADKNSAMLFAENVRSGKIDTLPEIPGLLLWRKGHIGVYEGNGYCIEARGFNYGTVRTKVKERDFTHWCESIHLIYDTAETAVQPQKIASGAARFAICTGQGVNVRSGAGTEFQSHGELDRLERMLVLETPEKGLWYRVAAEIGGQLVTGYIHGDYVKIIDE